MGRPWAAVEHVFVSYGKHDERVALLTFTLTDALESGEKFIYLVDSASTDDVVAWLGGQRMDAGPVLAREQLVIHPAERFVATDGSLDSDRLIAVVTQESREAVRAGYTGVRVCCEMAWALHTPAGPDRVLEYEHRLAGLMADGEQTGIKLVCHYAEDRVPAAHLAALHHAHSLTLTAAQAQSRSPLLRVDPLEGSTGLRLSGEVDKSNLAELSEALESTFRDDRDFHVHLADVHYVDVAAVRLLAQTAGKLTNGCRLVLRSPGPLVTVILQIYDWDKLPSLRLEGAR